MCGVLSSPFRRNVSKKGYLTQQDFCRILCSHITLIILRKLLPYLLDQTRQLSKLVDCWVNVNGERAWGPQRCRQYQKTSAWVSKRAMVARSEGHRKRAIMAERTRIAAREDRWRDNSRCSKCRCARRHRACAHPRALSHLNVCGKNRRSTCCRALCGYGYGTWMLQDDKTAFILQQKVYCTRSAKWNQEVEKAKTYQIGSLIPRLSRNANMCRGESLVSFLHKHDVIKIGPKQKAFCALFNQLCFNDRCVWYSTPDS